MGVVRRLRRGAQSLSFVCLIPAILSCSAGGGVVPGGRIPDASVSTVAGEPISLREIAAGKPTILNVWASWCGPCTSELPALARLRDAVAADGVQVVAVGVQDDPAALEQAFRASGATFPFFIDRSGQFSSRFKLSGVPETFLIGVDGTFVLFDDPSQGPTVRLMGPRDWDDPAFVKRIRSALTARRKQ